MTSGGHARSGPASDPNSARSDARGITMAVLSAPYSGKLPGLNRHFPKPNRRHRELWEQLWRTPQACVWIREPWRYPVVAELVRLMELVEGEDGKVGHWSAIRQRRDDLGLSTAGRRQEGWEVAAGVAYTPKSEAGVEPAAEDELGQRRQRRSQTLHEE